MSGETRANSWSNARVLRKRCIRSLLPVFSVKRSIEFLIIASVNVGFLFSLRPKTTAKMVDALIGTWKLETSENFEELLKELGVNMVLRKAATATKPNAEISKNGDEWSVLI